jgi:hypothetical protein
MKKLFIAALLALTVAGSAFAKDTKKVNALVVRTFDSEFRKASNVTWTVNEEYVKATFTLNNEKMEAIYNPSGERIGTSRAITIDELPVKTKRAFAKNYGDYAVKEAIEFTGTEENGYFISAENEKEVVVLKVNNTNDLTKFKVTKK